MKDTSKTIMAAVQTLTANTPETKEATAIVERLVQGYLGYRKTSYEWIEATKSHAFCVEFSGRLPFVAISPDLCTAIVLINQRVISAFQKSDKDLTRPTQTALEAGNWPLDDLRTEYASAY